MKSKSLKSTIPVSGGGQVDFSAYKDGSKSGREGQQITAPELIEKISAFLDKSGASEDIKKGIGTLTQICTAAEDSLSALFTADLEGKITYVNDAAMRLWGFKDRSAMIGVSAMDYWADSSKADAGRLMQSVLQIGHCTEEGLVGKRPDGSEFVVGINTSIVRDSSGKPIGLTGSFVDVTQRRKDQQWLDFQSNLLANVYDAIIATDQQYNISFWNSAAEKQYGWAATEVLGHPMEKFIINDYLGTSLDVVLQEISKNGSWKGEVTQNRSDGVRIPVMSTVSIVKDDSGQSIGFIAVNRDITERKRNQAKLLEAQKMDSIGNLAAGIAHDFNNVLGGVLGYADMISEETGEEKTRDRATKIVASSQRASDLVGKILAFGRGGKNIIKPVDLNSTVKEVYSLLKRSVEKTIVLEQTLQDGLYTIDGDPTQMQQILLNLCINASHAMPNGGTLSVTTENIIMRKKSCAEHPGLTPGNYVKLTVKDTGYGMTPEIQQRIFEPYFTTKKDSNLPGTGLGLAMVQGIVKNHNGHIDVWSEPSKGAVFTIFLPAGTDAHKESRSQKTKIRKREGTILLVDDEEIIRDMCSSMLELIGYTPVIAKDGYEAVEAYKKIAKEAKAVILDISMPIMDGKDAYGLIKASNPDVKVLITSGHASEGKAQQILDMGANGFLQKPFTKEQLFVALENILK